MVGLVGCGFPVEPGSDLPAEAPPAVLGPVPGGKEPPGGDSPDVGLPDAQVDEGVDATGTFDIAGVLDNPLGDPISLVFLAVATQTGEIPSGAATINIELRNPESPDAPGPTFDAPAPISAAGACDGAANNLVIPQSFSELLAADASADVGIAGQILNSNCIAGTLNFALKDALIMGLDNPISIPLNGTFQATRQGAAPCDF